MIENEQEEWVSSLAPPSPPRPWAETLPERRRMARRLTEEAPTIAELQNHASRYGTEQVVETAVELGHTFDACVRLQDACDRIDHEHQRRDRATAKRERRAPSEDRVRTLMGLKKSEADAE